MPHYDPQISDHSYHRFTGPARLARAVHALEGFLLGIAIDSKINDAELATLKQWLADQSEFADRHPFNEVVPLLMEIADAKSITQDALEDLLWICGKFHTGGEYYTGVTADIQRLQGILAGIIADGVVTEVETRQLASWIGNWESLKTVWPYAEIDSVLTSVLADGRVDAEEQAMLLDLFTEFSAIETNAAHPRERVSTKTIAGICACDPVIDFDARTFCFTGKSERCDRNTFAGLIEQQGAVFQPRVNKGLHYLIVGAAGNPSWSYSCYGRKVEQAATLRQSGHPILIVHEFDLWDVIDS